MQTTLAKWLHPAHGLTALWVFIFTLPLLLASRNRTQPPAAEATVDGQRSYHPSMPHDLAYGEFGPYGRFIHGYFGWHR